MKRILLSVVCLAAMTAAGFGGYAYYENQTMDPWLKANIAALATAEGLGQGEGSTLAKENSQLIHVIYRKKHLAANKLIQ